VRGLALGSYARGVALVAVLLVGGGEGLAAGLGWTGFRPALLAGVLVALVSDAMAYVLVGRGLLIAPDGFLLWWGASLLAKLIWLVTACTVLIAVFAIEPAPFLLVLVAAFHAFTAHQVWRLVRLADAAAGCGRAAGVRMDDRAERL
jgi:hypothetical protein